MEVLLGAMQRAVLQGGTLLLVGAATWRWGIARRGFEEPLRDTGENELSLAGSRMRRRVARIAGVVSFILIPIWLLRLYIQVLGFRDPFVPWSEDASFLIRETIFGPVWIAQGILLFVLAAVLTRLGWGAGATPEQLSTSPGERHLEWGIVAGAAAGLGFTLAMSSHALSVEGNRTLAVAADTLHALAAGAWIGSLTLTLSTKGMPEAGTGGLFAAQLRAFSPIAVGCVTVLVAMGVYLGWQHLGSPSNLWNSTYGRVLTAKVFVAGIALLMGFLNWRKGMPMIDSPEARAAVSKRAGWEVVLAVGVLILTGILTGTPRPISPPEPAVHSHESSIGDRGAMLVGG